jgi:hypothetical protein
MTVNHSCTPNVAFDLSHPRTSEDIENSQYPTEWNLRTLSRPIAKGETLTFFYPSTEWDMGAPFTCACGESVRSALTSFFDASADGLGACVELLGSDPGRQVFDAGAAEAAGVD